MAEPTKPSDGAAKPPPAPGPKMVNVTIDGITVEVPAGLNLIEVGKKVGVSIPHYCYHPKLTIAANCRMCLVEVSTSPKLQPACQLGAADKLAIKTTTPRVKDQQRATLEWILLNHPVDCAICDQAGECYLQDYYMEYDAKPSRLTGPKVLQNKRQVLGPLVVLDQERCIKCTRCVRFMDEIPKEPQLGMFNRGSLEMIDTFPGKPLNSKYAGNTIDICPVGALLSRDFRFKARAYFLSTTPSVCTGCERGCSVWLDHFDGVTYRYRPRDNPKVNDVWMCDEGRLSYKYLSLNRLLEPRVGRAPGKKATSSQAVQDAASLLKTLTGSPGLAVLASPFVSVEDLLAGLFFASQGLKTSTLYIGGNARGEGDKFLIRPDKNPNRKALEWIAAAFGMQLRPFDDLVNALTKGEIKGVYALGTEVPMDSALAAAGLRSADTLVVQAINAGPIVDEAHVVLPASPHSEDDGTFVNFDGHVQRFARAYSPRGSSRPHWRWAAELMSAFGLIANYASSREVFKDLANRVPELKDFNWDSLPPQLRGKSLSPLPGGTVDGRIAGYREYE
jgi:NADH-quinone oxidoreductase subunit G